MDDDDDDDHEVWMATLMMMLIRGLDNDGDDDDDDGGQRSIPLFAAGIELLGLSAPSHTNCKLELKMHLLDLNIANRLQHFVYQE